MEEIWKDIEGYEGKYQVSNLGRVKSLKDRWGSREKILKLLKHNGTHKYSVVQLCDCGVTKKYLLHRLVAETFIPNPNGLPIINHKDENPENNTVDNLEWCDYSYNINYGTAIQKMKDKLAGRIPWNKGKTLHYTDKLRKEHKMTVTHWKEVDGKREWY
jgi:hypothetical protein